MQLLTTWIRFLVGFLVMGVTTTLCILALLPMIPFRVVRIKICNYYGKVMGPAMLWVSGCPITIQGEEHLNGDRPAIYVSNHTSIVDIFFAVFLSPVGTVGVAKREVIYYPFFGQLYLLSGHLRIDRGKSAKAREGIKKLGQFVRDNKLSIYIWPEGTRSRSGRLLPFKKGIIHLAIQTGLPIVPVVIEGAHEAWVKNSLQIAPVPITVTVLPAISSKGWAIETAQEHLDEVWAQFRHTLPDAQQPALLEDTA